jgi:hypothetical protein
MARTTGTMVLVGGRERRPLVANRSPRIALCLVILGLGGVVLWQRAPIEERLDPYPGVASTVPASSIHGHLADDGERRLRGKVLESEELALEGH